MPNFCPTCGKPLQFENAEICPSCGVRIQPPPIPAEIRSPFLAAVLSFVFVGWGQWYNGKTLEGLKFLGAFIGSYLLMAVFSVMASDQPLSAIFLIFFSVAVLIVWVYGMYDAYQTANKINEGQETFTGKSGLFWLPVAFLVFVLIIIIAAVIAAFVFGLAGST
jgi:uncharacterized membrane protein YidH (DUF202 family)